MAPYRAVRVGVMAHVSVPSRQGTLPIPGAQSCMCIIAAPTLMHLIRFTVEFRMSPRQAVGGDASLTRGTLEPALRHSSRLGT